MKKSLFISLGIFFTALGILGSVLPLVPTTPFLLLAVFFFSRSSERMLHWLLNNKVCGEYLRNYREHRGMSRRDKWITLVLAWGSIGWSCFFVIEKWPLKVAMVVMTLLLSVYIVRLKLPKKSVAVLNRVDAS